MGKGTNMKIDCDIFIKGLAIQAEIEGMKAENEYQKEKVFGIIFYQNDFDVKAEELRELLEDEEPEKVEILSRQQNEKPLLCDCHGIEGTHEIGSACCLKKIANPQPTLYSSVKGINQDHRNKDVFYLNNKLYSRIDLMNNSYREVEFNNGIIWTCLKSKEIKE